MREAMVMVAMVMFGCGGAGDCEPDAGGDVGELVARCDLETAARCGAGDACHDDLVGEGPIGEAFCARPGAVAPGESCVSDDECGIGFDCEPCADPAKCAPSGRGCLRNCRLGVDGECAAGGRCAGPARVVAGVAWGSCQ